MQKLRWVYDLETYPNIFTMTIVREDGKNVRQFEVSDRKNDTQQLITCLKWLRDNQIQTVGFNNTGFDYPILHEMMQMINLHYRRFGSIEDFQFDVEILYGVAQEQIASFKGPFGRTVREKDCLIPQIDLYKIHHFDNANKSTSLKMLEFNMKSESIQDLPYPVGSILTDPQKDELLAYNLHDVMQTLKFYEHSKGMVEFRETLSESMGFSLMNFNDTKIGKEYFARQLEAEMPGSCYSIDKHGKRHLNQTKREFIDISKCLFTYYDFKRPEFKAVLNWFSEQVIHETKGVFTDIEEHELGAVAQYAKLEPKRKKFNSKPEEWQIQEFLNKRPKGWVSEEELKAKKAGVHLKSYWMNWRVADALNVVIDGFRFDFGVGGIHGSLSSAVVNEDASNLIVDLDVSSYYPNLAISNDVYPEHLSSRFCKIYKDVYDRRKSFAKNTPENLALKLALNGVYGDSNNKFSPFYDPAYTMKITINGQLSLCQLIDDFYSNSLDFKMIMANTDGITFSVNRNHEKEMSRIVKEWECKMKLTMERADYSKMFIRDCNNYIGIYK